MGILRSDTPPQRRVAVSHRKAIDLPALCAIMRAAEGSENQDQAPDDGAGEDDIFATAAANGGVVAGDGCQQAAPAQEEAGHQASAVDGAARWVIGKGIVGV